DGLRLRGNAEDGVDPHRIARLAIPPADGLLVHDLAVLEYDGHETRDLLFLDVALEEPIEARAAVGRRWYRRCGRDCRRLGRCGGQGRGGGEQAERCGGKESSREHGGILIGRGATISGLLS